MTDAETRPEQAQLKLWAYGAFTVGALVSQDDTPLELDLADLETAPKRFSRAVIPPHPQKGARVAARSPHGRTQPPRHADAMDLFGANASVLAEAFALASFGGRI